MRPVGDGNLPLPLSPSTLGIDHDQEWVSTCERGDLETGRKNRLKHLLTSFVESLKQPTRRNRCWMLN